MLRFILDFKLKYDDEKLVQVDILSELYHRCSPSLIPALVTQTLELCSASSDLMYKATKSLLKMPKMAIYSPACAQMSHKHHSHRRREML